MNDLVHPSPLGDESPGAGARRPDARVILGPAR